ncbi:MAG: hypothetical protein NC098_05640 [Lachnoclostridium sp.]|nr:hypothetical protein [Lachnoclostridium sp.]
MKTIKTLLLSISVAALILTGCAQRVSQGNIPTDAEVIEMSEILSNSSSLVDSIVSFKGVIKHICSSTSNTAFAFDPDNDSLMVRCIASSAIYGLFPDDVMDKNVIIKGMLREERMDESWLKDIEYQYKIHSEKYGVTDPSDSLVQLGIRRCRYERRYRGQDSIQDFDEYLADFRQRIENAKEATGKNYLSFYYLEVISVDSLESDSNGR